MARIQILGCSDDPRKETRFWPLSLFLTAFLGIPPSKFLWRLFKWPQKVPIKLLHSEVSLDVKRECLEKVMVNTAASFHGCDFRLSVAWAGRLYFYYLACVTQRGPLWEWERCPVFARCRREQSKSASDASPDRCPHVGDNRPTGSQPSTHTGCWEFLCRFCRHPHPAPSLSFSCLLPRYSVRAVKHKKNFIDNNENWIGQLVHT